MPTAPTVHRALPFCKAPCSMELVGSAAVEHALAQLSVSQPQKQ